MKIDTVNDGDNPRLPINRLKRPLKQRLPSAEEANGAVKIRLKAMRNQRPPTHLSVKYLKTAPNDSKNGSGSLKSSNAFTASP
jgi:hypothetical protein